MTMLAHAYRALMRVAAVGVRDPERRGVASVARPDGPLIWIHSAGRGEATAAGALAAGLREQGFGGTILATTFSPSGLGAVDAVADGAIAQLAPADDVGCVRRFLDHWRPDVAVVVEADVWPTMLTEARARRIPTAWVSASLSARAARRWRLGGRATAALFGGIDAVLAADEEQRARLTGLGAAGAEVGGGLKAAAGPLPVDEAAVEELRAEAAGRPIVVVASLHEDEEAAVVPSLAAVAADGAFVVVAPRYPDRVGPALAGAGGLRVERSFGRLGTLFSTADVVIMGGTFADHGGHNAAEPARFGRPIVAGPDMAGNAATAAALEGSGALVRTDAAGLAETVRALLEDPGRRRAMGAAAADAASSWAGVRRQAAEEVLRLAPRGRGEGDPRGTDTASERA